MMKIVFCTALCLLFTTVMFSQQSQRLVLVQEEPKAHEPEAQPQEPEAKPEKPEKQEKPKVEHPKNEKENKENEEKPEKPSKSESEMSREQGEQKGQMHPAGKGGHIPDDKFRAHFGRSHTFVINRPVIVNNQPTFQYGGYSFILMDPWPAGWAYTDDCYIDYINGDYFLFDIAHPGVQIALFVSL